MRPQCVRQVQKFVFPLSAAASQDQFRFPVLRLSCAKISVLVSAYLQKTRFVSVKCIICDCDLYGRIYTVSVSPGALSVYFNIFVRSLKKIWETESKFFNCAIKDKHNILKYTSLSNLTA